MSFTIGVISDSHGLLRPEIEQFLETCDAIIHAGDIVVDNNGLHPEIIYIER